jgi:hypothetical protein
LVNLALPIEQFRPLPFAYFPPLLARLFVFLALLYLPFLARRILDYSIRAHQGFAHFLWGHYPLVGLPLIEHDPIWVSYTPIAHLALGFYYLAQVLYGVDFGKGTLPLRGVGPSGPEALLLFPLPVGLARQLIL